MTLSQDILAELAEIAPGSALAAARAVREAATRHAQGSYETLFGQQDNDFPLDERFAVAARVAKLHESDALAAHYAGFGIADPTSPQLVPALAFARLLTFTPVEATPSALEALIRAGWSLRGIVTLAQLIAFVSFQSRVIQGFHVIARGDDPPKSDNVTNAVSDLAGQWHTHSHTRQGQRAPVAFTRDELAWEPWLAPRPLDDFFPDEQATLTRFGHQDSPYFRLLGRNLPLLEQRTLTDKGIFYTPDGLGRAERELAATVVSKINGCIYCAIFKRDGSKRWNVLPMALCIMSDRPNRRQRIMRRKRCLRIGKKQLKMSARQLKYCTCSLMTALICNYRLQQ